MSAYFVVDILEVRDHAKMGEYRDRVRQVVEQFGGRYLVVNGRCEVVEGNLRPVFPVMIEFPSFEQAKRWYDSEEYRELKAMRLAATRSNGYFVEGV